jgi:hypothetical protein
VLDSTTFSSIIYIWYEGGELRPSLVRMRIAETVRFIALTLRRRGRRCPDAKSAGIG